ncbi:glycosyltransferase [Butyricimonas sp. Marseille-P3923]|uniref:glycosyltransferase n=1 Tax=Butyricimonas sp. Marseille-P3923 TaxID=1987504 RepID=UPI000C0745BC|nr:glycosyltransferase [Butyricimonas sp. Marseille-P3923]
MFILLVSRGIPSKRDPHRGCFEKDQAEILKKAGHKVVVISVDSQSHLSFKKLGISHHIINDVDYYNYYIIPGKIVYFLVGIKAFWKLKSLQFEYVFKRVVEKHGKPDLIYSHYLFNSYGVLNLKYKYSLPLVVIEHWSEVCKTNISKHVKIRGREVYSKADAVITVSESLKRMIYNHFNVTSIVVPNMFGTEFFQDVTVVDNKKINFVTIGRLCTLKGFDLLISAFTKVDFPLDKWKLDIIGDGVERKNLQKQIINAGLENNIHLLGSKTKNEIVDILGNSNVFVLSSRMETFGVVFIEAMALGLPVIGTMCGGPEEIINASNGLLVPVEDVNALVDALKYMYDNYSSYDRGKIAEDTRNHFSPIQITTKLTTIFDEVLTNYRLEPNK